MSFQDRLALVKKEVEGELAAFFAKKKQEAKKISPHCGMFVDRVADFTLRGGKRTRAFLVWAGHHSVIPADDIPPSLMHAMMGVELFQSFALIHDDIIDGDTLRRGGPTVHTQVGVSMAILAGDLALAWADELMGKATRLSLRAKRSNLIQKGIAASPSAPRNDMLVWELYQRMKEEVILGQSLDVLAKEGKPGAERATINRYKTAWYTVIRPLQIGAAVGGASQKTLASFVPYGLAVGEAYQLRDDFLDGAMSEEEFQKSVKKLVIPKSATILLTNFARFVLTRQS